MEFRIDQTTILTVIWFFIGFGAGFALLRFWKILVVVVLVAVLLPFAVSLAGVSAPFTSEQVVNAFINGINLLAGILGSNPYAAIGFIFGVIVGLITFMLRVRG
ncbi:MAG: hypothetical protein RMI43_03735 [Candidatus Caldarchaeum sp.]|nr:hypothetical protein [Candidatus Caldarchaeum sp.]MCX8200683.1 hypothetical protein [Candidatus Caldarchaeum sp.]MDW8063261.1 hypothetical protein [Candidatus Caldarchaeum sp.]MDW8435831.1 hypothetical protein [Candidatus Caldarchaeum sp.]